MRLRQGGLPEPSSALISEVALQSGRPAAPSATQLVDAVRARFGESVLGVVLYGSCLHEDDLHEGLVDLYVIVNRYRDAYPSRFFRALAALLPPNVHYFEIGAPQLRAKVAVISVRAFERGTTRWFHPYLWARFAQPVRVLYAKDPSSRQRIHRALAAAVLRFHEACIPAMSGTDLHAESTWRQGLGLTYASELRAESNRASDLVDSNRSDYERLSALVLPIEDGRIDGRPKRGALLAWWLRRQQGRILSVLRLSKALFTFENGVDYLAWKIERHSGVEVEITPRIRRYPLLWGPKVLWQLLRRGAVR